MRAGSISSSTPNSPAPSSPPTRLYTCLWKFPDADGLRGVSFPHLRELGLCCAQVEIELLMGGRGRLGSCNTKPLKLDSAIREQWHFTGFAGWSMLILISPLPSSTSISGKMNANVCCCASGVMTFSELRGVHAVILMANPRFAALSLGRKK